MANRDADLEAEIAVKSKLLKEKDGVISTLNNKTLTLEIQLTESMNAAQNSENLLKTIAVLEARISSFEAQSSTNSSKSRDLAGEIVAKSEEIDQLTEQIRQMRTENSEELKSLSKEIEQVCHLLLFPCLHFVDSELKYCCAGCNALFSFIPD